MNKDIKKLREEAIQKYFVKSKRGKAVVGLGFIMTGGPMFLIGLFLAPFIIGIPLLIMGFFAEIIGVMLLVIAIAQAILTPFKKHKFVKA